MAKVSNKTLSDTLDFISWGNCPVGLLTAGNIRFPKEIET